ncbi:hypothetical protein ACFQ22_07740 [Lentilactobacillus raoultii]|uniref:Uncharacterized protein n=1 Tax=Lentilactobacillus raoultii TaxID=1987503 RepID=A0ABW3PG49_9LACO|nr:hypothetical protein [Lentilactobacillus raoultii]
MQKKTQHRQFYKKVTFWLGLFLVVTNIYLMIKNGGLDFNFLADFIAFAVGIVLLIDVFFDSKKAK